MADYSKGKYKNMSEEQLKREKESLNKFREDLEMAMKHNFRLSESLEHELSQREINECDSYIQSIVHEVYNHKDHAVNVSIDNYYQENKSIVEITFNRRINMKEINKNEFE